MRRAAWFIAFFAIGLLASWQSALLGNWMADRFSWPLIHLHTRGCWDVEHCRIAWWGYGVILASIIGPAVLWGYVGFRHAGNRNMRGLAIAIAGLLALTVLFYLACYAFM
jgi:hypothetical protein